MTKRTLATRRSPDEKWFAATLLFQSIVGDEADLRPLCEERVVLFRTATEDGARAAALRYGASKGHSYRNVHGERVEWRFVRIEKLEDVEYLKERGGWEVASRFVRKRLRTIRGRDGTSVRTGPVPRGAKPR